MAGVDVDGTHLNLVLAHVAHDLRGRIKPMGCELSSAQAKTAGWWHLIQDET